MLMKKKFNQLVEVLYPRLKPVDQLHFFTMAIYLLCGTALFIGSSIFLYFDKDYEGVNKTIIFLLLNIVCLIFFRYFDSVIKVWKTTCLYKVVTFYPRIY